MALARICSSNFSKIFSCVSLRVPYNDQPAVYFSVLERGRQSNGINNGMSTIFFANKSVTDPGFPQGGGGA